MFVLMSVSVCVELTRSCCTVSAMFDRQTKYSAGTGRRKGGRWEEGRESKGEN